MGIFNSVKQFLLLCHTPRPVLFPALLIAACTLGLGVALHGRSLRDSHFLLTGTCGLANLLSAMAAFVRAGPVSVRSDPAKGCLFLFTYPMARVTSEAGF
jgi:hypothetical protein